MNITSSKKKNPILVRWQRQAWLRFAVQGVFFIAAPSVYASAFTAVKNAFVALGQGLPLELSAFAVQFLLLCSFTVLFGRFFCGWVCAFGALGDWVYAFSRWGQKKCGKKLPYLPLELLPMLQMTKYAVLTAILTLCFLGKGGMVNENSPWTVFSLLRAGRFSGGCAVGMVLLVLTLVGMAVQERFFCQFLCPMGAVFSLLPTVPFFNLQRKKAACPANCGACKKLCPVSYQVDSDSPRQGECIRCGRCAAVCPRGNLSACNGLVKAESLWVDMIKAAVLLALMMCLG